MNSPLVPKRSLWFLISSVLLGARLFGDATSDRHRDEREFEEKLKAEGLELTATGRLNQIQNSWSALQSEFAAADAERRARQQERDSAITASQWAEARETQRRIQLARERENALERARIQEQELHDLIERENKARTASRNFNERFLALKKEADADPRSPANLALARIHAGVDGSLPDPSTGESRVNGRNCAAYSLRAAKAGLPGVHFIAFNKLIRDDNERDASIDALWQETLDILFPCPADWAPKDRVLFQKLLVCAVALNDQSRRDIHPLALSSWRHYARFFLVQTKAVGRFEWFLEELGPESLERVAPQKGDAAYTVDLTCQAFCELWKRLPEKQRDLSLLRKVQAFPFESDSLAGEFAVHRLAQPNDIEAAQWLLKKSIEKKDTCAVLNFFNFVANSPAIEEARKADPDLSSAENGALHLADVAKAAVDNLSERRNHIFDYGYVDFTGYCRVISSLAYASPVWRRQFLPLASRLYTLALADKREDAAALFAAVEATAALNSDRLSTAQLVSLREHCETKGKFEVDQVLTLSPLLAAVHLENPRLRDGYLRVLNSYASKGSLQARAVVQMAETMPR